MKQCIQYIGTHRKEVFKENEGRFRKMLYDVSYLEYINNTKWNSKQIFRLDSRIVLYYMSKEYD